MKTLAVYFGLRKGPESVPFGHARHKHQAAVVAVAVVVTAVLRAVFGH